ncbi:histidinol-phosphatase [Alkalihalobacillus alcalophilus ATCC 27647 = CGMCC 1.3604]|uniref:Histidinol-phosphatase n=1 Tax=Alkalihalobacillus alcalophilus ATCC 27647 = CGMCC 1.3604 TaxID=1218173 RepID=A0A094XBL2_ALKAL|nr:histidinol-phosphatase HisJ [Alkalihalobacillus alcalophilus]KGA96190.1 histidinol phosphatase [Alkalihalobacillus alcalophilus ATCC 27647 = CGMCC 1.3604]MED1561504.1 histidinol-phosphatase HisJ [Alkalihalobacillus alcalophilus]THG91547.1 histidinol-phosphatase [Alkalihalobacillus alcalophilus ATCC 27647 = CGMCC 1.3604]
MILFDGHVHTPFCPHGSKDSIHAYCEQAIKFGLTSISFTEHAPLPEGFVDPVPLQDSAMSKENLPLYIKELTSIKRQYANQLKVNIGLEVDYIEGFEQETTSFLNEFGPYLDDSLLSVHFLKYNQNYTCIDYSPETFEQLTIELGSTEAVHELYYQTIEKSIAAQLGPFKPKRIGHITLTQKFIKKFPTHYPFEKRLETILPLVKEKGLAIDVNGAGTLKPLCGLTYPPLPIINKAAELQIPLIYGSDAHQIKGMMSGQDQLPNTITFVSSI